ncbi:hypothetical protein B0H11DRAFT_1266508 [Mycena galericulata]|nr:hypothetical protein B0H11DRAFT_1266508 [Mycena galericulata]
MAWTGYPHLGLLPSSTSPAEESTVNVEIESYRGHLKPASVFQCDSRFLAQRQSPRISLRNCEHYIRRAHCRVRRSVLFFRPLTDKRDSPALAKGLPPLRSESIEHRARQSPRALKGASKWLHPWCSHRRNRLASVVPGGFRLSQRQSSEIRLRAPQSLHGLKAEGRVVRRKAFSLAAVTNTRDPPAPSTAAPASSPSVNLSRVSILYHGEDHCCSNGTGAPAAHLRRTCYGVRRSVRVSLILLLTRDPPVT